MAKLEFKTNIKCGGCIAAVKPYLDKFEAVKWSVDTANPDKILTVEGKVKEEEVIKLVREAGYEISSKKKRFGLF
jgi:copper chaperone